MKVMFFAVVASAMLFAPLPLRAAPALAPVTLPDCAGKLTVRPSTLVLTCADAGISASRLVWTGWGSAFTAGVGVASVNDCDPYCAAGHFHHYRIVVIASGRQRCGSGRLAYARVTYGWIGRAPFPQNKSGTIDPVVPFRC